MYVVNVADPSDVLLDAEYDEWGRVTSYEAYGVAEAGWPIPFGFAGGLYDETTGLVRFGARDYDPEIGRWTSKDPILFEGGQANLYVYAGNDPANYHDPQGRWIHIAAGADIGAAVNTIGYLLTADAVTARGVAGAVLGGAVSGAGAAINPLGAMLGGIAGTGVDGLISGAGVSLEGLVLGGTTNLVGAKLGADLVAKAGLFPTKGLLVSPGVKSVGEDLLARAMGRAAGGELAANVGGRMLGGVCE